MSKLLLGLKPYKIGVAFILVLTLFRVLAELYLPTIMADIVDNGIVQDNRTLMLQLGGVMILVAAFGTICACISSYYSAKVGSSFAKDLREKMFYKVESFGIEEANSVGISSLINRTTNDISQVQQVTMMILRMVVLAPLMCIGGIVMEKMQSYH